MPDAEQCLPSACRMTDQISQWAFCVVIPWFGFYLWDLLLTEITQAISKYQVLMTEACHLPAQTTYILVIRMKLFVSACFPILVKNTHKMGSPHSDHNAPHCTELWGRGGYGLCTSTCPSRALLRDESLPCGTSLLCKGKWNNCSCLYFKQNGVSTFQGEAQKPLPLFHTWPIPSACKDPRQTNGSETAPRRAPPEEVPISRISTAPRKVRGVGMNTVCLLPLSHSLAWIYCFV